MLERTLMKRLESKADYVKVLLSKNENDWEETCYQLLCKNFGFKVNAEPMLQLAEVLPFKILLKHLDKSIQLEALLFGQAGFLEKVKEDEYTMALKREYSVLRSKFKLDEKQMNVVQ